MKNKLIVLLFISLLLGSFKTETIEDSIDGFAGASNSTFEPQILDSVSGASSEYDDEDEEDEEDDRYDD